MPESLNHRVMQQNRGGTNMSAEHIRRAGCGHRTRSLRPCARAAVLLSLMVPLAACHDGARRDAAYVPGLGEIMAATQMRHIKLWYAAAAGNWPLAAYELDELHEGFDDAVRFHPTHKDAPAPIASLLPEMTTAPLQALESAVQAQDHRRFVVAYDDLTAACNACHRAARFGFNVVMRPTANPYSNQDFTAAGGRSGAPSDTGTP